MEEVGFLFEYKTAITVDDKGRIVIPQKVREDMGLQRGEMLGLEYQDGIITIFVLDLEKLKK